MDLIICLGKMLNSEGSLDWVLQERVEVAVEQALKYPQSKLVLTGGHHHFGDNLDSPTQAAAMLQYIKAQQLRINPEQVILEEKGDSTINQLIIIKRELVIPNNYTELMLVTDEFHMSRAFDSFKLVMGEDYKLEKAPAQVNLSGHYRQMIEKIEKEKYKVFKQNVLDKFTPGDDKAIEQNQQEMRQSGQAQKTIQELVN